MQAFTGGETVSWQDLPGQERVIRQQPTSKSYMGFFMREEKESSLFSSSSSSFWSLSRSLVSEKPKSSLTDLTGDEAMSSSPFSSSSASSSEKSNVYFGLEAGG